jgi:hypothetical protein
VDDDAEPWVRRLRDGEVPPVRGLVLGLLALSVVGALLLWAEALHLEWVAEFWDQTRRAGLLVLVPPALLVAGPVAGLAAWWASRRDRRVLARIRRAGAPVTFHLPVTAPVIREPDELPDPAPVLWTVDAEGLHGWSAHDDRPVHDLPWDRIRRIDVATHRVRGNVDEDYGLWFATDRGHVVLAPRGALGRPSGIAAAKLQVLARVLRALRPAGAS